MVENLRSILTLLPLRELEIRRCCERDAVFRAICADYEEAAAAFRHWVEVEGEQDPRVREYGQLVTELEDEILARLDAERDGDPP